MTISDAVVATATHRPWERPLTVPPMAPSASAIGLTNRYITRDGRPIIPVSGEFHPTRVPRADWERRLRAMRNGGITTVAAYVFWIHHQPTEAPPSFEGPRDIAAFVGLAASTGLDVVLRIGPWCHGEVRNGGFPDWVQRADVAHRTDDPRYLALVEPWFRALGAHLAGRVGPGPVGPGSAVIGIQVENEIYDQPEHIATLKRMAIAAGLTAPLWMATAWGGAQLPDGEVLPMYGGYADGFWVDADAPWDDTFREHFFFTHVWDDPGIGADVRALSPTVARAAQSPSAEFPPVTCELGGGMATAYHRRPVLTAEDIAAVANAKIGNGSAWQGYYMYAGGLNPGLDLQESQATGYPNDLPQIDYDFHAPIGSSGRLARTHALLRQQHAFLAAFGERLATMPSSLPDVLPAGVHDAETPRWAVRSDGERGFVFVNRHQPRAPLGPSAPTTFRVELPDSVVTFPDVPLVIPPGTIARFPFGLAAGGLVLDWATASPLAILQRPGGGVVVVLIAHAGIAPRVAIAGDVHAVTFDDDDARPAAGRAPWALTRGRDAVVVLPAELAEESWVLEGTLFASADELDVRDGAVTSWSRVGSPVARFDPATLEFVELAPSTAGSASVPLELRALRGAGEPAASYGARAGRAAAPPLDLVRERGEHTLIELPAGLPRVGELEATLGATLELTIEWAGDVALLLADGEVVSDRFFDGTPWHVLVPAGASEVELFVLPLHPEAEVWLPPAARKMLADGQGVRSVRAQAVQAVRHR